MQKLLKTKIVKADKHDGEKKILTLIMREFYESDGIKFNSGSKEKVLYKGVMYDGTNDEANKIISSLVIFYSPHKDENSMVRTHFRYTLLNDNNVKGGTLDTHHTDSDWLIFIPSKVASFLERDDSNFKDIGIEFAIIPLDTIII